LDVLQRGRQVVECGGVLYEIAVADAVAVPQRQRASGQGCGPDHAALEPLEAAPAGIDRLAGHGVARTSPAVDRGTAGFLDPRPAPFLQIRWRARIELRDQVRPRRVAVGIVAKVVAKSVTHGVVADQPFE